MLTIICVTAIELATARFPDNIQEIKNVDPLPVSRQLMVLVKLRLLVSLKAHALSNLSSTDVSYC